MFIKRDANKGKFKSGTLPVIVCLMIVLIVSFSSFAAPLAYSRELRLGAYKYLSDNDMKVMLQPFVNYLSSTIKAPVKLYITSTYSELSQRFISGEMDMAIMPPYAYVKLADKVKTQLLASMKLDGSYYYNGIVAVSSKSGISALADLKGRQFAYVAKDSASGYLYPRILFKKIGLDPDAIFSKAIYTGSHAESIKALKSGLVDGIAIFKGAIGLAQAQGTDVSDIKIISETEKIPHEAFIAQYNMNEELARAIKQALINFKYSDAELQSFTKTQRSIFKMEGWVVGLDSLYDTVREVEKLFPNPELTNLSLDTAVVTIGYYPRLDVDTTLKAFEPLIEFLSAETGMKFKMAFSPNYLDVGNQLIEGNYSLSILTPVALLKAREKSKITLDTLVQRSTAGKSTFTGVIVCKGALAAKDISELRNTTFAFTDPDSISGRLYPLSLFKKNNIQIKSFFKKTYYAGSAKKAVADVVSGAADACACNELEFNEALAGLPEGMLKVIYRTPEIPYEYWTVSGSMPARIRDKIKAALDKISSSPELKTRLLQKMYYDGFSAPAETGLNELSEALKTIM